MNDRGTVKIINTVPYFTDNYESSILFLRSYYRKYPAIFTEYFAYHCKDSEERHLQSIAKYPLFFGTIEEVHRKIVPIIQEISEQYNQIYQINFPIEVNLIVGGFGSNAYTYRQIIPNITFSLEKLLPELDSLRTIVAHEFGHAAHNIISNNAQIDWGTIQWENPLIWLYREGAAVHFSRKIVPNLKPSIYFSFDNEGEEWLEFCTKNIETIKNAFFHDYNVSTPDIIFKEWFSINGGTTFGHSRLAYFIGDLLFQDQVQLFGEDKAITAWNDEKFIDHVQEWLCEGKNLK
ncbi:hypothetical protein [Bacillus sp. Bva_UNVM-123]|uniref:hypothetical protein n=1 Tax=Bacillus sp. Bva_UNVM-123 TaxID=2829798 RepID=UPI00391EFDCF